jgi:hypothetical protein
MIARTWHGITVATQADEYLEFLVRRALPDYQSIAGNRGVTILRRIQGEGAGTVLACHCERPERSRVSCGGVEGCEAITC